jgi:hypothetical protein
LGGAKPNIDVKAALGVGKLDAKEQQEKRKVTADASHVGNLL